MSSMKKNALAVALVAGLGMAGAAAAYNYGTMKAGYTDPASLNAQGDTIAAGDIIMTGTPAGVSQLQVGDKLECGVDGVGTLAVTIGKPE